MWIINCILLMLGSISATLGISFYLRNREATGNIRLYILFYGLSAAVWCITYGLIGITNDFSTCMVLRKIGIFGIDVFLLTEVYLATDVYGSNKKLAVPVRIFSILLLIVDYVIFSVDNLDIYIREEAWTTWKANPDGQVNRNLHAVFMTIIFLILFSFGIYWVRHNRLRRLKRFLFMVFLSNFIMLFFTVPDTVLPAMGKPAISTSGIGAAFCAIVMWYGASQLFSFDIRAGNIKDRLFDFMEAGIIVLDTEFRISMVNRYAGQLVEMKDQNNLTLEDFFLIDSDGQKEIFSRAVDEIYSTRLWSPNGTRAFSVRVKSVEDDYGDTFCYMCVFLDISDEVEAASRLEIASQAKSRFLAQMSHEIRTPINAVLGMNEMILRESKEDNILEYAENIDSAGNTLLSLINSILDFSKIEDGKMDIIPVRYDTASLINDLVNSVEQRADTKGLSFRVEIDENLPSALIGDDVRVSQVIMNLLTNAVKYTKKGSVTLTMKVKTKSTESVQIYVSVKDTGIGIREEDIGKLFESFERLDQIRNHNIEGTGLGISIVKSLLGMMGSRLSVESTYGKGSDFSFVILQKIADAAPIGDYEERIRKSHRKKGTEDLIFAPEARVLLVDDNDMNLKVTNNLLKLCQIRPEMVSSGEQAIERMREKTYDVVFLDHMMPGMDGIETLHQMQKEGIIPENTVMIALTANAVVGARESYLAEGFQDYLSKPIEIRELVKKLTQYLPEKLLLERPATGGNEPAPQREAGSVETGRKMIPEKERPGFAPADERMDFAPADERMDFALADERMDFAPADERMDFAQADERMDFAPADERMDFAPADERMDFAPADERMDFAPADERMDFAPVDERMDFATADPADAGKEHALYDESGLRGSGIDPEQGLHYCAEDASFYREMLKDFTTESVERLANLKKWYAEENWRQYEVQIHAMKSNLRMLGAAELAGKALELEEAAKNGIQDLIRQNHDSMIAAYSRLSDEVKSHLGLRG